MPVGIRKAFAPRMVGGSKSRSAQSSADSLYAIRLTSPRQSVNEARENQTASREDAKAQRPICRNSFFRAATLATLRLHEILLLFLPSPHELRSCHEVVERR